MERVTTLLLLLVLGLPNTLIAAADDKALQAERREAQKQRQQQKSERQRQNNDALKQFRSFTADLKRDYQEQVRSLDTEFRLQKTELTAQRQMEVAEAEAQMQQSITQLFLNPQQNSEPQSLEKLRAEMKSYQDRMYAIRREAASREHEEFIANENRKHELLTERDNAALAEAKSLGLLKKHTPILAQPIGGNLTTAEERWNEREEKEVERLYQGNQRYLADFNHGARLREWEINNHREDFELEWRKRAELHELGAEQQYLNSLMLTGGNTDNPQALAAKISEISKQNQMINIKYNKLRQQNHIKRREERRKLLGK